MNKRFISLIQTVVLIVAVITSIAPNLFSYAEDLEIVDASDGRSHFSAASLAQTNTDDGTDSSTMRRQGAFNCAISIAPLVLHGDDPLPTTKIVPTINGIAGAGFFDVSSPEGRMEQVAVGDTLVMYLYFENVTGTSDEEPCQSGGAATVTVDSIALNKDGAPIIGNARDSMIWPGVSYQLASGEDTYGLIPFDIEITDDLINSVNAVITYSCTGSAYCSTGPFIKTIGYPSPDIQTLGGQTYGDFYGRNPVIDVVGPRAQVQVTSPAPIPPATDIVVAPFSVLRYVIELTSLSLNPTDDITSITDIAGANTSIPQCRADTFPAATDPLGWYEDTGGTQQFDSGDLAGPNGPAVGALGNLETVYCVFDVVMDPSIINNQADSSFTLGGTLLISNGNQTTEIEVAAPPVVILEAGVSVSKTIIAPANPLDGVAIGGTVRYRIVIANTGETNLDAISIVDSLVGPIPYGGGILAPNDTYSVELPYTVEFDDPSPLVNTVTVMAHPVGAPQNFFVQDNSATSIAIQGSEITAELKLISVAPAGEPMAGSVLTYRVEYCNNGATPFTNLQYVTGFPSLFDGVRPAPHYVDSVLQDGSFNPGCMETAGTEFTYTVPSITDPNFSDPVFNTIRVRAVSSTGAVKYGEFTLVTNLVSSEVEISAYRYNIDDPGTPLSDSDAALRGETIYYHFDVTNKTATNLCGAQIRHYVRNSQGLLVNGNPFIIPNNLITWSSGIDGQLNADPGPGNTAFGDISFLVDSGTPDPLNRIFEIYAPQDCVNPPFPLPYIDRAGVTTDISDIQVNTVISVFSALDPAENPLAFGFRTAGAQYKFNYTATNVGGPFMISTLQYCVLDGSGSCTNQNFPVDPPNFFAAGLDFLSFETRSDQSEIIGGGSGLSGDEPTPLQILVTLEAIDQNSKSVTIRTVYSFPLLTAEIPGGIISGDEELVRGDTPVPYAYAFTNQTNGLLRNVKVFNLLETNTTASPGFYEEIGVPGFPAGVFYEVCQTHGDVIHTGSVAGTCNLTYHDGLPSGSFEMRVLLVGERASDGQKLITLGVLEVAEIPHLLLEKTGPGTTTTTSNVDWTITVENQSDYQHVDFRDPLGFQDVVTPTPPAGSFTTPSLADGSWTGLQSLGGGVFRLPSNGQATYTPLRMTAPLPDGFGQTSFTNTVTMTGSTSPVTPDASFVSREISETAQNSVSFECPIFIDGVFIDNPDVYADTDSNITVGETKLALLGYQNRSSSTVTVTTLTDDLFVRENGRPLDFVNDIIWPGTPGVLAPNQTAFYTTIITIRPIDFPNPEPFRIFSWDAFIELQNGPSGCEAFDVEWYFEIVNPVQIEKTIRDGFDSIIFPGEEVRYQIALQNISEHAAMQVSALNDSILELDSSPLRMDFDNGATNVPSGRLNPLGGTNGADLTENGVQDSHIVLPTDPETLVNTATVHFYVINELGNGPANMEKGPNFPMSNIDDATVSTANPLELIITPSVFDAAAGSVIDVTVQVTNTSVDFSITNIVITSGDAELTAGLLAAGYVPPISSLAPVNSQAFTLTIPHYQIPPDYSDATLSICAQATGTLQQAPPVDLAPVQRCATINIEPPDLTVEKEVFSENTCTIQLPDDDGDMIHEATIGANVYYDITITNNSTTQTFDSITITDTTNDGGNLTTLVQSAFETQNGGSTSLSPGASVSVCVAYLVTPGALAEPVLTNTIVIDATDSGIPLAIEDEVSVDVVDANIRISKRSAPIVGFPGSEIEYTITITNVNPDNNWLILDDVWDTLIADQLPGNPSYHDTCVAGGAPPNFASCNPSITSIPFNDPNWTWPFTTPGVIPPDVNQPAVYTYTYEIQDTDPDPLINTAGVMAHIYVLPNPSDSSVGPWTLLDDGGIPPQPVIAFDETIASVAVTNSQLLVRKVPVPSTALVGTTVRYEIGITNVGDRPVTNLQVLDCNPFTPCDTNIEPFGAGFGGDNLTTRVSPLAAQTSLAPFQTAIVPSYTIVMPAGVDLQPGGSCEGCDPFINTVYAQGRVVIDGSGTTVDTLPGSDTAIVDLIVPGLRVTKTPAVGSAGVGAIVQYTIEVFNTGDQPIRVNSVVDVVPGSSAWTPLTTMSLSDCTNPSTFAIGPSSPDLLQPEESLCATVDIIVTNPSPGNPFIEFINTVQVNATADPGGLNTTIIDSASAEIDVRNLGLTVTKQAYCIASALDPSCLTRQAITQIDEGKQYEYEITIVNTSTTPLQELRISDPDFNSGAITQITDFTTVGDGSAFFDPGESFTFTYLHTASIIDDIGVGGGNAYTNTVTVSAIEDDGDLVQPRTASHTIVFVPAQVEVTKVGCIGTDTVPPDFSTCVLSTPFAQPGDFIWYQVTIVNPSNISIDTITVTDSIEGLLDNNSNSSQSVVWPSVEGTLPGCTGSFSPPNCPQAVYVYRGSNLVTAADTSITNTAVVNGVSGAANVTANDSATVFVTTSDLLITITEDNSRTQAITGTQLDFTVTITNLGTDTINNVEVLLPFLNGATPLVPAFDLLGSQSIVITPAPTYTVTNLDTVMDFEVIVNGLALGTLPVSDTDLWSVSRVTPGLSVTKLADRSIARVGETITYTFIVENTSTTTAVNNLVVSDPLVTFPSAWPAGLSPSQTATQQVTYVVTGAEGNPITNIVTVTGNVAGSPIAAFASVDVSVPNGDLLVENTPNVASATVGDTVSFTYRICNLSTTDNMTNVQLSDEGGALTLPSTTLAANACFSVIRDVTLADTDIPELFRTVTGSGTLPVGDLTQAVTSSVTVVSVGAGDIRLEVLPSTAIAQIGSTLDLTFVITNVSTGTPLTITNFLDGTPWYTDFSINPIGEVLNPGEILVFTGQTLAAGGTGGIPITAGTPDPLTGTWTVTVEDATNAEFSHEDSISIPIVSPGATLSVVVEAVPQNAVPGGTVVYTYRVQNLAGTTANNVTLNALQEPVGSNCLNYTIGSEGLWTPGGVTIPSNGQAIATAVCTIDTGQAGGTTVDHTIEVLDDTSLVQDTAVIQTPVSVPLGIEIISSDPAIWRVENPVTITYRIFNASTATTVTNIIHSISNPSPCEDIQFFDAAVGGNPVAFNGTLAPLEEVFVTCTHDPVQAQPSGQITVRAGAEGVAEGSPVVATAELDFDVVALGLSVQLTGAPDNGGQTSTVDEGERVNFTLLLENTGQTSLILPPATEDPVTSRVYDANTPSSVLGTLGDLYTYLESECTWPLAPTDTCQIAFNDTFVTSPDLTFTPLAIHPSLMQATVEVMLWDELNSVPVMQTSTWNIEVQRPSIVITSLTVSPNTPMNGGEVLITAVIQNDGFSTLENVRAVVNLSEIVAYVPQDGVVLTSGNRQSTILNSVPMDVIDTVLVPGEQTTAQISWDVDRVGQFQVQVITTADNTAAGASLTTVQDNMETTFTSVADPDDPTTDPDGNPLDPNALDPTIVKTSEPEAAFPNQDMTFTITITNGSTSDMSNISFVDAVPDAFTVVSASTTRGASVVSGQLVTATTGQLAAGERVTITIVTTVAPDVDIPSLWTNEACANVEGREPVCATVEIGVGTDAAILPTTGFGEPSDVEAQGIPQKQLPLPEEASNEPVAQGIPGTAGIIPLLGMGLVMLSTTQVNRQRWVIGGAAVAIVGVMALGLLFLGNDDDDDEDGAADAPTLTPTLEAEGQPTPTLVRRGTAEATATLPPFDTPQPPENLPFPPTIRPSPTPYILPTASGPRRLEIPKLNLSRPVPIVELPQVDNTWDVSQLGHNVGWLEHTTWLDPTWGNTVIVGHVQLDSEDPGPFYHLGSLAPGDEIVIWEGDDRFVYEVSETEVVHSTAVQITHPTSDPVLTLLTCTNWDFDRGVFADRLIIRAIPIERPTG